MAVYKEIKTKLNLEVSNSDNDVMLKVDCYYGTIAKVTFIHLGPPLTVSCGENKIIGKANEIKGKSIIFNGTSGNPLDDHILIKLTIYENNGKEILYLFPVDYTGKPDYNPSDSQPSYKFYINFL